MVQAIFGIGNIDRRDDGIGVMVVDQMKRQKNSDTPPHYSDTCFFVIENDVFCLDDIFLSVEAFERALFIDAMKSTKYERGSVIVFRSQDAKPSQSNFATLTHNISILEYLRMVKETQPEILPTEMIVLGVVVEDLSFERGLSDKIRERIPFLTKLVNSWICGEPIIGKYLI